MRSKVDETFVIVKTLICPLQISHLTQKYISVLVGSLDAPNQTFLVDCHPLDRGRNVNSSINSAHCG